MFAPLFKNKNRLVLLLSLGLLLLSLACTMPGLRKPVAPVATPTASPTVPPSPTPTQRALPPALVESDPPQGAELPLDGYITLAFNQPMDRPSVESALKVRAFLVSDLVWSDDATVSINPGQGLPPGESVSVEVETTARAANGVGLQKPINLSYRTAGYLLPAQRLPEPGAGEVNPASAVVASFNHPVVPLGADPASLPAAFTLDPPVNGRGEWVNTSTYIFYADPALEGGKAYIVSLAPTLHGIDGNPLQDAGEWSFTTASPRLDTVSIGSDAMPLALDGGVAFTFNQPMDRGSVEANFSVLDPAGAATPGGFTWDKNDTEFTWKPNGLLGRATTYTTRLDGGAQARGGTPLGSAFADSFTTVPDLRVERSEPAEGGSLENYASIVLHMSGPIQSENLGDLVSVEPRAANLSSYWNETDRTLYVSAFFLPATDYRLNISGALRDPWGGALGEPYTLSFRSAPLPPGVTVGAYRDTHFITSQDNAISAQVSGLASLPVSVGSVPLADLLTMIGPNGYDFRQNYRPADQQTWQQTFTGDPNRTQLADLFLSPDGSPLPSGVYLMRLALPSGDGGGGGPNTHLIVVSDVHAVLKLSPTNALVWAVDLRTNEPLANAPVTLYDTNGEVLAGGQTDAQGIFQAAYPARQDPYSTISAVIGQPGDETFGLTLSDWNQDIDPWNFNLLADFQGPRRQAYLYTDRPIYRPGQTVHYRGIIRQAFNGRYEIPDISEVTAELYDDIGQKIDTQKLPLSAYGTVNGSFDLPADLRPGSYSLSIPELNYSAINIPVADYRKPEINLSVAFKGDEQLTAGVDLTATVQAHYFFDAPAGNIPVEWTLYAAPAGFDLPGYTVGLQGADQLYGQRFGPFGQQVGQGNGVTQPDGTLAIQLGPAQADASRQQYTLEVVAQDESGLPVSARGEILVNPADLFIGLRSASWVGRAEEAMGFDVQTVDAEQKPIRESGLRAEFSKVAWTEDKSQPPDPFFGPFFKPVFTPVASADFNTGADGKARLEFTPPEPGPYQLSVYAPGGAARSEILVWVGGPGQFALPDRLDRHIEITPDRDQYKPGETAQVFVPNPFDAPAPALITLERGTILDHQIQTLQPGGNTLSFPLAADEAPNTYLSVTLLGRAADNLPDFRQGYANLPVEPLEQTLNVQLTRQPERTGPGETVDFEITVTDAAGKPVQGEFSLAVVDLAALALADPNSVDILPAYYGEQPVGVRTAVPLAVYASRKEQRQMLGGGGGGGDGGITTVRERFPDTAFWQADIVTDANGKAQISVPLPDSLTTWRVETRGVTADTRVGQADTQVVTTKDLLVRPVTPRFLVAGDQLELSAIVQNNTSEPIQGEVNLQAEGFQLDDPAAARQPFDLPADGRARVSWWGRVGDLPKASLVFSATAQGGVLQDAARPVWGDLPVLRYTAPQAFRTAGTIDDAEQRLELVSLPRAYDPSAGASGGSLDLELSPSLAAAMVKALEVFDTAECQCNELTLSNFLPNLEMYRTFQEFGLSSSETQARLERTLDAGVKTLINRQNFDGGWGWQPGGQSDPFITAYILFGLARAHGAGVLTAEPPLQRAAEYLNTNLITGNFPNETWQIDRLAFAHFALASAGFGDPAQMLALYQERARMSPWAQALLALALERSAPGSAEARTLLSDLGTNAVQTAAGVHWELPETDGESYNAGNMTSTLTNSAIVTYALAQRDPGAPLVADAVRYLTANRGADGGWTSTYTTAWTLMALTEVMKATGELRGDFGYSAALNDAPVASGQAGGSEQLTPVMTSLPLATLYPDSPNLLVIERGAGDGRLYYSAVLNVDQPADQAQPLSKGLTISRQYFPAALDCSKEDCAPIASAQPNEKVNVRLALTVPRDAYHVMVADFIPAGAEILDLRLLTTQMGEGGEPETQLQYDPTDPFSKGWGWWLFNQPALFDDHIQWSADYLPAGSYELSYTFVPLQAGEYQVLPARAWEFYFPEVQGTSAGNKFLIQ